MVMSVARRSPAVPPRCAAPLCRPAVLLAVPQGLAVNRVNREVDRAL